jgi:hypothetical protein
MVCLFRYLMGAISRFAAGKIHEQHCYSVNNQAALIVHSSGNYSFSLIIIASHCACVVYCAVYIYSAAVGALI